MRVHELTVAVDLDAAVPERVIAVGAGGVNHLGVSDARAVEHAVDLITDALARADLLTDAAAAGERGQR